MNRGDWREAIFRTDQDRTLFVDTLAEACQKTGWQVHAFCLMPNHFHWVLETANANLVAGMKWLLGTYASRFNRPPLAPGNDHDDELDRPAIKHECTRFAGEPVAEWGGKVTINANMWLCGTDPFTGIRLQPRQPTHSTSLHRR